MKVMCIIKDKEEWVHNTTRPIVTSYLFGLKKVTRQESHREKTNGPAYGEVCEVIRTVGGKSAIYYILSGYPLDQGYRSTGFMPIQDQETEVPQEKEKLKA